MCRCRRSGPLETRWYRLRVQTRSRPRRAGPSLWKWSKGFSADRTRPATFWLPYKQRSVRCVFIGEVETEPREHGVCRTIRVWIYTEGTVGVTVASARCCCRHPTRRVANGCALAPIALSEAQMMALL